MLCYAFGHRWSWGPWEDVTIAEDHPAGIVAWVTMRVRKRRCSRCRWQEIERGEELHVEVPR